MTTATKPTDRQLRKERRFNLVREEKTISKFMFYLRNRFREDWFALAPEKVNDMTGEALNKWRLAQYPNYYIDLNKDFERFHVENFDAPESDKSVSRVADVIVYGNYEQSTPDVRIDDSDPGTPGTAHAFRIESAFFLTESGLIGERIDPMSDHIIKLEEEILETYYKG